MTCPNCGTATTENAHFCQNCGHRFDEPRKVEPIRIDIAPQPEAATFAPQNLSQPVPPIVVREKKNGATAAVIAFTALLTLLIIGVGGLIAYYLITRPAARRETIETNAAQINANSVVAAVPSPTTYEDLKNKLAPPEKRTSLLDESFSVAAESPRTVEFTIEDAKGARVVGGFRLTKGKTIDFSIVRGDVDGELPADESKPLLAESNTRNKIVNHKLKPGDYQLVFENKDELNAATVAAEFFVVTD